MKKLLFAVAATLILAAAANAQTNKAADKSDIASLNKQGSAIKKEKKEERKELRKLKGKEVSYQAKEQFSRDFDNVSDISWIRTDNFDRATFTKDGKVVMAYYDADAELVGTTMPKTFADLPANAQQHIDTKYKGYRKEAVILFDDNEQNETDMFLYGHQFDDEDNYFVELKNNSKELVVKVNMNGDVSYYTDKLK